jgi:hypothetical protein
MIGLILSIYCKNKEILSKFGIKLSITINVLSQFKFKVKLLVIFQYRAYKILTKKDFKLLAKSEAKFHTYK